MKQLDLTRITFILFLLFSVSLFSQEKRTISGNVVDEQNVPLLGANVIIKNTNPPRGTTTDFDGNFTLEVIATDKKIVISYLGYQKKTISIVGKDEFSIQLQPGNQLDEVIVTALDIKRDEKSLGYAVQSLDSKEVSDVKVTNISNKLQGKVAGVFVNSSGNGPTGSSNVTIRGQTSLTGNSQALYVVNGIPITNGLFSPGDGLNGSTTIDFGNSSQVVNPDDIQSISVLKGPAAAALYGSRAANGVILITTKRGSDKEEGWNLEWNLQTVAKDILRQPDFQDTYGFGGYGFYSYRSGDIYTSLNGVKYYDGFGENWGPRMDGQLIKQFNSNGEPVPFTPAEDNFNDFFNTGVMLSNNISVSNNSEDGDFRLSYTYLDDNDIVPNSGITRNTLFTSVGKELFDDKVQARVNLFNIRTSSDNIPNGGYDESNSIMYGWLWYPRQVGIDELKPIWREGQVGEQQRYVEELWVNNPWLLANENTNTHQENRIIGNATLKYDYNDKLSVRARYGVDLKDEQRQFRRATSTKAIPGQFGSYREDEITFSEINTELIISYSDIDRDKKFNYDLKLGGNMMKQKSNILSAANNQLLLPSLYTLTNNRAEVQVENPRAEKNVNSIFGFASLSWDDWIYFDATARNDWSSTLPQDNNSYFYPSFSLSTILSEQLDLSESVLDFFKLRAAWAQVGSDTNPYLLSRTYNPQPLFGDNPAFSNNSFAANPDLKPERTTSFEVGTDMRFFENKLKFDFTYYNMLSSDQIIFLPRATSSGKQTQLVNAGEIRSEGIELQLDITPIETKDFSWNSVINVGANEAIVESLPDGVQDSYPIVSDVFPGDEGSRNLELVAVEGMKLGQLRGLGFQRNEEGQIIHENGIPQLTDEKVLAGSYQPDARIGWQNTFRYKNFSFGFLFDSQVGGKIYSRGHALFNTAGTITNADDPNLDLTTLQGRAEYNISYNTAGEPVYSLRPGTGQGVIGPGVDVDGTPNETPVAPRDYFYAYYGNQFNRDNIEAATYDADWIKLRQVMLSYNVPGEFCEEYGLDSVQVSLVGRNLLLITDVPTIDPETYSIRNGIFVNGFGSNPLPSTSTYGLSLNVKL
ncbi:SusC/RagA family TonB-linked outer membrane protein [Mesohalobacter halotolerans]|uniref:SusC/RagA family TonB-linked outer membrane protein n=1 Tax=Mesohalobacter halotolerans TaxID=1883405 RepID=A0A4U5TS00_9FLAO|nr:SusC/RagA family TonB-linked outer membrane protein [Mesohalobacter halotolerans]MBS3739581.1 SusC/RagA family TonB-linked outer membrane protein [Psychroflexus sp.]TKS56611.1 SusC/RagA family TonB-linked outer membrane protein [Mesohalobacter halotolerans]